MLFRSRVYVEANQSTDAIATFTKVLVADPANLVAAKSLAEIHLGRNDNLEALKKFKLYRAISGDRKVDDVIAKLEPLVAPKPVTPPRRATEPPPPPPKFQETDKGKRRTTMSKVPAAPEPAPLADAFEMTSLSFEPGDDSGSSTSADPFPFFPTRDVSLAPAVGAPSAAPGPASSAEAPPASVEPAPPAPPVFAAPAPEPVPSTPPEPPSFEPSAEPPPLRPAVATQVWAPPAAEVWLPAPEAVSPPPPAPEPIAPLALVAPTLAAVPPPVEGEPAPPATAEGAADPASEPARPSGRALADLYYAQGHFAEALQIYDDLVARHPFDEDLKRMRRDAEARLLPAATSPAAAAPDIGLERRLARIRALKQWLSLVQAG